MKKDEKKWIDGVVLIAMFILAGLFVYYFSTSTSPIIKNFYKDDSAIFQVVGREWAKGKLLYVDVFDHKGPIIFLIDALGYGLTKSSIGIMYIQIVLLFLVVAFIYRAMRLEFGRKWAAAIAGLAYLIMGISYSQGNLTEEYSLLFIVLSIASAIKYMRKEEQDLHPLKYAFVYGCSFMAICLMRMTSAISICCIVLVVLCILLGEKKWLHILQNMVAFLAGAGLTFLPFCIYFLIKGTLKQMLFATFIYNFMYASGSSFLDPDGDGWNKILFSVLTVFCLLVISILHIAFTKKQKDRLGICSLLTAVMTILMLLRMNRYMHYYLITMPYVMYIAVMLKDLYAVRKKDAWRRMAFLMAAGLVLLQTLAGGYKTYAQRKCIETYTKQTADYQVCCNRFMSQIPPEEKEDFLVFASFRLSQWYLVADVAPSYHYPFLQDWWCKNSSEMEAEVTAYLQNQPAKWMVVEADYDTGDLLIPNNENFKKIIQTRYEVVDDFQTSFDYRRYQLLKRSTP